MKSENNIIAGEEEKYKKVLDRTYTERFLFLMKLVRINKMLRSAKIVYSKK